VNTTPLRLALVASFGAALAGCGHGTPRPGEAARGWIVSDEAAGRDVLRTCSRPSPDREGALAQWIPTPEQIRTLESALPELSTRVEAPASYQRQYVGIVRDGRRLVYVNAWPARVDASLDPSREAMRACDGGDMFWGVVWDPELRAFSEFEANGAI
jgi:hypothetical protein